MYRLWQYYSIQLCVSKMWHCFACAVCMYECVQLYVTSLFSLAQQMTYMYVSIGGSFKYWRMHFKYAAFKKQSKKRNCSHVVQTREKNDDSYTIKRNFITTRAKNMNRKKYILWFISVSVINFLCFFLPWIKKQQQQQQGNSAQASFNFITCSFLQCTEKCN